MQAALVGHAARPPLLARTDADDKIIGPNGLLPLWATKLTY